MDAATRPIQHQLYPPMCVVTTITCVRAYSPGNVVSSLAVPCTTYVVATVSPPTQRACVVVDNISHKAAARNMIDTQARVEKENTTKRRG